MDTRWELEWWAIKMFLGAGFFLLLTLGNLYNIYKWQRNPNAEWGRHVKHLRSQGIDPSYIKRSPEWDTKFNKKIRAWFKSLIS